MVRPWNCSGSQTYVFSDSILCMGGISQNPVKAWKEKIDWFQNSLPKKELDRIDGEPMEFEWKKFPRIHYITDSRQDPEHDD